MRTPESSEDEGESKPKFPTFNTSSQFGQVSLQVGMDFDNLETFKTAIKNYNIALGREIKWKKNDSIRARAVCAPLDAFCSWNSKGTFQLKTLNEEHSCCRVFVKKAADGGWVAIMFTQKLTLQPELKRSKALNIIKEEFSIHLASKNL